MGVRVSQGGLPGGRQCLMKDKQELGKRLGLEQSDEQGQKSVSAVPFPPPPQSAFLILLLFSPQREVSFCL